MNVRQYEGDGALLWWDPRPVDAASAAEAFAKIGKASLAPKARTEYEALREAVSLLKAKDQKLERHKSHEKNGLEVLQIERDTEENAYARRMGAKVEKTSYGAKHVVLDYLVGPMENVRLQERFIEAAREVSSASLTKAIVEVLQSFDGERQREAGGIWFVPGYHLDDLYRFVQAMEEIGVSVTLAQVRIDERLARHVGQSLTDRMRKEAERLQEEIAGLKTPEAIEARKLSIAELQGRVQRYKDLLGTTLQEADKALNLAQTAAMIAAMSAMGGAMA